MGQTQIKQVIHAPRAEVYRALLDPKAIETWRVPEGMRCKVHQFEAVEGGRFRVSLTYEEETGAGKTTAHTDTYHGHFAELVPDTKIVESIEFETTNPQLQGVMTITTELRDKDGGTEVVASHAGLPPGVSPEDNETGWKMSMEKLAALLERP